MFDGLSPTISPTKILSDRYVVSVRCRWLLDRVTGEFVVSLLFVEGVELRCVDVLGYVCVWLVDRRSVVVECMGTGVSVSVSRRESIDVRDCGVVVKCVGTDVLGAISWR